MPPPDDALPSAIELRRIVSEVRGSRARVEIDERAVRRRALMAALPLFLAEPLPGDALTVIAAHVRRAAGMGELRSEVFRFPSEYCSDSGRAINNGAPDWPATLQGLASRYFALLESEFLPRGFHVGAEIMTWPQMMPGDVALFLGWRGEERY